MARVGLRSLLDYRKVPNQLVCDTEVGKGIELTYHNIKWLCHKDTQNNLCYRATINKPAYSITMSAVFPDIQIEFKNGIIRDVTYNSWYVNSNWPELVELGYQPYAVIQQAEKIWKKRCDEHKIVYTQFKPPVIDFDLPDYAIT